MLNDGKSSKPEFGTDVAEKLKFDYAKGQSRDLPTPKNGTEVSIGTPQTLEQGLQSVCKKAFELNKSEDQQQKLHNISAPSDVRASEALAIKSHERSQPRWRETLKQIMKRLDYAEANNKLQDTQMVDGLEKQGQNPIEGRFKRIMEHFELSGTDAKKLQQMAERSELSKANSEPQDTQTIVHNFKDVISLNLDYSINKSLEAIKKENDHKQSIDQKDIIEIHAGIHSTILASGVYYLSIKNSLPLKLQESKEYVAKAILGKPMTEFQKTIRNFLKALDKACPQKYSNSLGSAFELEQKALWPAGVSLDDQDLTTIRNMYDEVEEKQKALIKSLDSATNFSQYLKNNKEERRNLEKDIKNDIERRNLEKDKKRSNSIRSHL